MISVQGQLCSSALTTVGCAAWRWGLVMPYRPLLDRLHSLCIADASEFVSKRDPSGLDGWSAAVGCRAAV